MIAVRQLSGELKADNFRRKCSKEFCILFFHIIGFFTQEGRLGYLNNEISGRFLYCAQHSKRKSGNATGNQKKLHLMPYFTLLKQLKQQHYSIKACQCSLCFSCLFSEHGKDNFHVCNIPLKSNDWKYLCLFFFSLALPGGQFLYQLSKRPC